MYYIIPEYRRRAGESKKKEIKKLTFNLSDFKYLELKNRDIVYALPIEPFLLPKELEDENEKIVIYFELYQREAIKAADQVFLFN